MYDVFPFLKVVFIIANNVDPDEMQKYLGLHCLPKYPLGVSKGLMKAVPVALGVIGGLGEEPI